MKDFEKQYSRLNTAQRQAVDTIEGPVIVIAGPGTGKTQLLSMRVANILKKTDSNPGNILCLTFTEAAAENMRSRISALTGSPTNNAQIYTFHGFGLHIINEYPEFFQDRPLIKQLNELGQYDILEKLMSHLGHSNPLSKKFDDKYLHLPTVMRTISWAKQAGLSPDDLRLESVKSHSFFSSSNKYLDKAFSKSPSAKDIGKYRELYRGLSEMSKKNPSDSATSSIQELAAAIDELDPKGRHAKSITEWRNQWLTQYKTGKWKYKDQQRIEFLKVFSNLYEDYETTLAKDGLFTFDDMLIRAHKAISENEELKLSLQEQYQYILVDEYQDTNGIQEKILNELADNPINEGRPNIMVVGDDDQAIYRFQGAMNSVMADFINRWREPKVVVLKESYRSGSELLKIAASIISSVSDRLESKLSDISKHLNSSSHTKIRQLSSRTETENYINIATEIKKLIQSGVSASTIAVIAPKHKYLEGLAPFLINQSVPISYERREQILVQPRIIEILDLVDLTNAASSGRPRLAETYLAKVLSSEYWQLSTKEWWQLAVSAQKEQRGWLHALSNSDNKNLKDFSEAIKILAKQSKNQPFDLTLAQLLGNKSIEIDKGRVWDIPWRDYYFNKDRINENVDDYLKFIGQFTTLIQTFEDWLPSTSKYRSLSDFSNYIELYRKSSLSLLDTSPYRSSNDAVSLTTVYKAKGLEWDNVFILNTQDDVWGPKTRTKNVTFKLPSSLTWIEPLQNDDSDLVRLFYVGLTRARKNLFLTSYEIKDTGKDSYKLLWLEQISELLPKIEAQPTVLKPAFVSSYEDRWHDIYTKPTNDLAVLLAPVLRSYKLSATHLNDFLAIDRGGPQYFLLRHLLKVPDTLNSNAMYGDAIHKTLEYVHTDFSASGKLLSFASINKFFSDKLGTYPLADNEFKMLKKRGVDNLTSWIKQNKSSFSDKNLSEYNLFPENISIGDAKLTGKIDLVRQNDPRSVSLIDYKTSKPLEKWEGNSPQDNLRAYNYRRQLLFYKLLLDNSSFAKAHSIDEGVLEFIGPDQDDQLVNLSLMYEPKDVERLKKLVLVIWKKIINLDLPDTSKYSPNLTGLKSFESDLIDGKI